MPLAPAPPTPPPSSASALASAGFPGSPASAAPASVFATQSSSGSNIGVASALQPLSAAPAFDPNAPLLLPSRPALLAVPATNLPGRFCSGEARNAFYAASYKPALALADANNSTVIAHLKLVQQLFDLALLRNDPAKANIFAAEAQAYKPIADTIHAQREQYDALYTQIMALPVSGC